MNISIGQQSYSGALEIVFWEKRGEKIYAAKPCPLVFEEVVDGYIENPTLKIGMAWANEFMKAMAEELDKKGIKTDSDAKIAGTLEATRYHLEDLRTLMKIAPKKESK